MAEIQGGDSQEINKIKQSHCKRCGNTHGYQKGKCLAWGTTCSACGKKNIGQRCAPTKMKTRKDSPKHVRHTILNNRMRFRIKSATIESVQWTQTQESPAGYIESLNSWRLMQFNSKETTGLKISTELQIRLPDRPGTHILKAKVDTGAEGNTLPLWTFRRMFPDKIDDLGHPRFYKKVAHYTNCIQWLKHNAALFSVHTVCT